MTVGVSFFQDKISLGSTPSNTPRTRPSETAGQVKYWLDRWSMIVPSLDSNVR